VLFLSLSFAVHRGARKRAQEHTTHSSKEKHRESLGERKREKQSENRERDTYIQRKAKTLKLK
jgi:hypothetical protein